jgi:iron complex outermembrane receptor protein
MKLKLLITIFISCASFILSAQDVVIKGTVTDAKDGSPLPGVNIVIKGTTKGLITSVDGFYTISAPSGSTIVYSFIGYLSKEISVANSNTTFDIALAQTITGLDEIVVIGYGTVKKSDATGSVSVVSTKDFNRGAITSPQDLVVGKTSGVVITSNSGAPGSGSQIRIRGGSSLSSTNDPLVVVDGIPLDNGTTNGSDNLLNGINPNDIETFTVLKDASATAIYGSRASNGVIIITTKKGNKAFKVEYSATGTIYTLPNKMSVLSGDEFRQLINQKFPGDIYADRRALLGSSNTDWQNEIFKNSTGQDHNLSISGSAAKIPIRLSLGYNNQNGILINTGNNRTSGSINVNPSLFDDHLKIELNLKGMIDQTNWGKKEAIGNAITYDPTQPVRSTDTIYSHYGGYFTWLSGTPKTPISIAPANPVAYASMTDNKSTINRSIGNVQLDYKVHFLPDLRAVVNMGYDYLNSTGHDNAPTNASWIFPIGSGQNKKSFTSKKNEVFDSYLNYVKDLGKIDSKIDVTAGYSMQHFWEKDSDMTTHFIHKSPNDTTSTYYISELYLLSFFGRLNYTLFDKYLFTFTLRNDQTSKYSPDTRSALFPSFALSWKMNNEAFIKNLNLFSNLKLRLSYGLTGQQQINKSQFVALPDYIYMPLYTTSREGAYYQFGNTFYPTLRPGPYDAHIKWEETQTYNIGLDYGFLKDRITGSIDYYSRTTNNLLNNTVVPAGTNFSNYVFTNIGNLTNKGLEFSIDVKAISTKDWFWQIGYNIGYNQNKITKLTSSSDPSYQGDPVITSVINGGVGNYIQRNTVGYPASTFFVYQQVYNSSGVPIEGLYVNRAGTSGVVTGSTNSMYRYKSPAPVALMGISSRLSYKNIEFSFSGRVSLGNYVYNNIASSSGNYNNLFTSAGYLNNVISAVNKTKFATPQYFSDYYLENASFFRMDNIRIGYNFNNLLHDKLNLQISATIQNAFVITNYSGLDPEINNGIDNNIYPRPRTYNLGISADF